MKNDENILRELANKYFELANSDKNRGNMILHKSVNDLKQPRPIVLIDEIPWSEMNIDDELTLCCENDFCREIEFFFRTNIYKWIHLPADMVLKPYYSVPKVIKSSGIGVRVIENEHQEDSSSHTFIDQFQIDEDLEMLHNPIITYDHDATLQNYFMVANIIGDILPVKISGQATGYALGCKTMDEIVFFRGLETLFLI